MKPVAGNAIVSCYVDAISLLVMILLLILSRDLRNRKSLSLRIFHLFVLCVSVNCVFPFVYNAMYMQTLPWCHTAAVLAKTLRECVVVVIVALWIIFIDNKLNGEKNLHSVKFRMVFLPLAGIFILLIVNLFTGIVFTYSEENLIEPKPLLYVIFAIEFACFVFTAHLVHQYDKKSHKVRFLHISPMILSIMMASGTQLFAPYDIGILGYMIGVVLLCISLTGEYRFVDEESGMYNREYLSHLFDLTKAGKNDLRSVLIIEAGGDLPTGFELLRTTFHKDYDVIRMEKRKFLVFLETDSRSDLQVLTTRLEEAVAERNASNPGNPVQMTVRSRVRGPKENSFALLCATIQQKDEGDPVQGVVSMISELDRLDNELKLAADIQSSILPLTFPPFPDRTEFELFASMTPAKEVGGDFYDFFLIDKDHLGLVIADVSGKGIPASLLMMVSKTLIKNQLMEGNDPAGALEHVNLQLYEHNTSLMFVTVWLAVLEISTGKGIACNAGHENPVVRYGGGEFERLKYKHDRVIGVSKKAVYHNREFTLRPGDCVFVYTDGVTEATNTAVEMFGEERLVRILNQNADAGPEELINRVHQEVDRFVGSASQFDDITMLCVKYYGPNRGE